MTFDPAWASAAETVAAVKSGAVSARSLAEAALARLGGEAGGPFNAVTKVLAERALAKADRIDAKIRAGEAVGPLAGVAFGAKNLFDVAGLPTEAGSKINRDRPPASRDATLVERLEAAGAILVATLHMGEYAYDFTGSNVHDGPARNPHDPKRMPGGSSSGSAAAVAGGLTALSIGSDTNGSIRVPSALCGIFGLKPTYGRLSRAGTFPFVSSFDHVGPFARSVADLALAYDAMQGPDPRDPAAAERPAEPSSGVLERGADGLRIAIAGGYFAKGAVPEVVAALERVAAALGATARVEWPEAERARSAAFLITAAEGAALHLERLRRRPHDFDPEVRERLLAGAMVPAAFTHQAQKFRRWFREESLKLFRNVDVILAPATPCPAPLIGQKTFLLDGVETLVRPNLGLYTQPISFIGLPVAAVPVAGEEPLPIGVQIIAAPWREDAALRAAFELERMGVATFRRPSV